MGALIYIAVAAALAATVALCGPHRVPPMCSPSNADEQKDTSACAAGANAEGQIRRAPAQQTRHQRKEPDKAPPAGIGFAKGDPSEQYDADHNTQTAIDAADVIIHDHLAT
jgi:hypothetical protein